MTNTATRSLPTDWNTFKPYLPAEPDDSTVANLRRAVTRLDRLITTTRAELDQIDTIDRGIVNALVDAATDDDDLELLAARLDPGNRAPITHRLTQLQHARNVAGNQLNRAGLTDPAVVQWRARCADITREWQFCISVESPEERFDALCRFAERHRPSD